MECERGERERERGDERGRGGREGERGEGEGEGEGRGNIYNLHMESPVPLQVTQYLPHRPPESFSSPSSCTRPEM